MINVDSQIDAIPCLHGKEAFANVVRDATLDTKYDCIAVELPASIHSNFLEGVKQLPYIQAILFRGPAKQAYLPIDPCDAFVEGARQSLQKRIRLQFIGPEIFPSQRGGAWLPDSFYINKVGFKKYLKLVESFVPISSKVTEEIKYIAHRLTELKSKYSKILWIGELEHFHVVKSLLEKDTIETTLEEDIFQAENYNIHPDQLYFALGELPLFTGFFEQSRQDVFAQRPTIAELLKNLFMETRYSYVKEQDEVVKISPAKVQISLNFMRNLALSEKRLMPDLMEMIQAAKGVFGDSFAEKILKSAKYYPFFDPLADNYLKIGIDTIKDPIYGEMRKAPNIFKDPNLVWKRIKLKQDPKKEKKEEYKYYWNSHGMCSHLPEDVLIENLNARVKSMALASLEHSKVKTEKFTSSIKDGLDIRETLRNWHSGDIYVKEEPVQHSGMDAVVILYDENHDDKYPNQMVWSAEHNEESTLTFFGTDPFENMIGPGIAECSYGGLSLIFPPKPILDPFRFLKNNPSYKTLSEKIIWATCKFSRENNIAVLSKRKPGLRYERIAQKFGKKLVWVSFQKFNQEKLERVRKFHVLNGKEIRSIASRFIGY